jgi:hypothetical protein
MLERFLTTCPRRSGSRCVSKACPRMLTRNRKNHHATNPPKFMARIRPWPLGGAGQEVTSLSRSTRRCQPDAGRPYTESNPQIMERTSGQGSLRDELRRALTAAMKTRDVVATAALRTALGAIDNAEAVDVSRQSVSGDGPIAGAVTGHGAGDVARRDLSEADIRSVVESGVDREAAAARYDQLGPT